METYCLKCRKKQEMREAKAVTLKNGSAAQQGVCAVCGSKVMKMGKSE